MDCRCATITGTEMKFALSLSLPGGLTMDDVDFTADFYIYPSKVQRVTKAEMERQDDGTYVSVVDTALLRSGGPILCQVEVSLPDASCADGIRTEIVTLNTGEYIENGLRNGNIGQA